MPGCDHFITGKETRYPFYSMLGDPQNRLDGCEKFLSHWNSIPGPFSVQQIAIPTELPWASDEAIDMPVTDDRKILGMYGPSSNRCQHICF